MIEPQENNDSTVQPVSKTMSSNAVLEEIFFSILEKHALSLEEHERLIQGLILRLGEIYNGIIFIINPRKGTENIGRRLRHLTLTL